MSSRQLTRGPLPPSVYWRRRAAVAMIAAALVFGIAQILSLGGGEGTPKGEVQLTGGDQTTSTQPTPSQEVTATPSTSRQLAAPVGVCPDEDVAVTPAIDHADAGQNVAITLQLETVETPACTWNVSPSHLTVKITSGTDDVWSTLQCPKAVPRTSVVVRQDEPTQIQLVWDGARHNDACSRVVGWPMPGYYHVAAAALGGEPQDVQFALGKPVAPVITKTAQPRPTATPSEKASSEKTPTEKASSKPSSATTKKPQADAEKKND